MEHAGLPDGTGLNEELIMKKETKQFIFSYWGDFAFYSMLLLETIIILFPETFKIITLITLYSFMLFFALYQVCVKKKRKLRDIHYLILAVGVAVTTIEFFALHFYAAELARIFSTSAAMLGLLVGLVRPIIWLYKKYKSTPLPEEEDNYDTNE